MLNTRRVKKRTKLHKHKSPCHNGMTVGPLGTGRLALPPQEEGERLLLPLPVPQNPSTAAPHRLPAGPQESYGSSYLTGPEDS